MEKVLAINLNQLQLEAIYRICSQMKIRMIEVRKDQKMMPIGSLLDSEAYQPGKSDSGNVSANVMAASSPLFPLQGQPMANPAGAISGFAAGVAVEDQSLIVMCDLSEKHMDKLLAALRLGTVKVHHKAVLTPVNQKWNAVRMLAEMDLERRSYEQR